MHRDPVERGREPQRLVFWQAVEGAQPGMFSLVGDGVCVGRDSASPVSPDYSSPYPFKGGTIDLVIVDVSGDHYVDHEKEVLAYIARD
jgi:arylsulfatase